ncbi:MAG TPA: beta-phosphoglucomutase [Candidatus Limnocylindrales bacterium]
MDRTEGSGFTAARHRMRRPRAGSAPRTLPVDGWRIRETAFEPDELARNEAIFALGNGNIGFRGNFEDGGYSVANGTYINGFFEEETIVYPEPAYGYARTRQVMLNVADTKPIRLFIGDDRFDLRTGEIEQYDRSLDLRHGVLSRTIRWRSPGGVLADIHVRRIVSLARREIAAIEYTVTLREADAAVRFESLIDGATSNLQTGDDPRIGTRLRSQSLRATHLRASGSCGVLVQRARNSGNTVAAAADHECTVGDMRAGVEPDPKAGSSRIRFTLSAAAQAGQPVTLTKYIAYRTSLELPGDDLADCAQRDAAAARSIGFEELLAEQKHELDRYWEISDVRLDGDDELQQGIRFNLFSLLQAAGRDGRTSIAAKGLSGEGYEGHYFWDAETYALPYFIYTHPDIARHLLLFRCRTLDKARSRARELGHRGALFPWRTIAGEETSPYFPAGTAQYHIDADIAFALSKYVSATGDRTILLDGGAELLFETARFWLSLGCYVEEQGGDFCINEVTGPDEYTALVNNNFYTNLMAQRNLEYACAVARDLESTDPDRYGEIASRLSLDGSEVDEWARAAARMRLPFHRGLGIHAQDDLFLTRAVWDFAGTPPENYPLLLHYHPLNVYRFQVLKQPDVVLAQVLLPERFTTAEKKRNFDYYDPLTTGDSSLAPCIQSVAAADLGYTERAYSYFRQTARMDLDDVGGNTAAGVHTAAMAGTWMSLVYGFAGMRDRGARLCFNPRLPARLTGMCIRLRIHGRLLEFKVDHRSATYVLLEGDPLSIFHRGRALELTRGAPVSAGLQPELRAVIFDLDGVLTNTAEFHYLAWKRLADEMGWPFDRVVNERLKGVSRLESLEIVLEHAGVELPTAEKVQLAHRKNEYFGELIRTIMPGALLPGVAELLGTLREAGVKTAVASVSHNVWEIVSRLGITDSVDAIVDPAALVKGKPDPEAFFTAADMLGIPYEDCAAVEDAQVGIEAIKAARMLAVGIGRELAGADWRLDRTDQLTYDGLLQHFAARNATPVAKDGEVAVSEA